MTEKSKEVLALIQELQESSPFLRIGQLIVIATGKPNPFLFNLRDEDLLEDLKESKRAREYCAGKKKK